MQDQTPNIVQLDENAVIQARMVFDHQRRKLDEQAIALMAEEVLHRLSTSFQAARAAPAVPNSKEIDAFCDALIGEDENAAAALITNIRAEGASLDTVYLGYFAQAARRLGVRWENDHVMFSDVTIAAGRMYAIMRGLRHVLGQKPKSKNRHAFFAALPSESHTLGVSIAADMFRQRGWQIDLETALNHDALVSKITKSHHSIIGISASHPESAFDLTRLVVAIRIVKPDAIVMVSGRIVELEPDIGNMIDADYIASNMPEAIESLEKIACEYDTSDANDGS